LAPIGGLAVSESENETVIPEEKRREIFLALVKQQDRDVSVPKSRAEIAKRFNITVDQVREIEAEGLDNDWPPL
jgi:hypothetical protein